MFEVMTSKYELKVGGAPWTCGADALAGGFSTSKQGWRGTWLPRQLGGWALEGPMKGSFSWPPIPVIAEHSKGACDLFPGGEAACRQIAKAQSTPDDWLLAFMAASFRHCTARQHGSRCLAVDIGSNLGLVSIRLMQIGFAVLSVEPQADLCCASTASITYNQFQTRSRVFCGGASSLPVITAGHHGRSDWAGEDAGRIGQVGELPISRSAWRYGHTHALKQGIDLQQWYTNQSIPMRVPLLSIGHLLGATPGAPQRFWREQQQSGSRAVHFDFIKLDTDSVDCNLLQSLLQLQHDGIMTFESASLEVFTCKATQLAKLLVEVHNSGYHIFRAPAGMKVDKFPELTLRNITLSHERAIVLWEMAPRSVDQWQEVLSDTKRSMKRSWHAIYQLLVTKLTLHNMYM